MQRSDTTRALPGHVETVYKLYASLAAPTTVPATLATPSPYCNIHKDLIGLVYFIEASAYRTAYSAAFIEKNGHVTIRIIISSGPTSVVDANFEYLYYTSYLIIIK